MSAVTRFRAAAALLALCAGTTALASSPAQAQYFGRNKVQYRTFDFRILRTTHFDIYYYPEEEQAARDVGRMNERWYARLSRILEHEFEDRQPFVLYASHPHFQQTSTLSGDIGEGTGGVTEAFKQRIILPMAHSYEETDHVVGHELVHAFQYDISGLGRAGGGLEQAAQRYQVPLWFSEGMAEYLTVGPVDAHTTMWLRDAALTGRIPTLEQLTYDPSFFPYRWGQAFWAYVGGRWGDAAIGQILKQVGQGVPFPDAFQRILNVPLEDIVDDWGTSIRRTYLPLLSDRREAREEARPLITLKTEGGRINLAPSLSPDGTKVAFLSELEFLDVELYIANAETGEIIRRLVRGTAFDPHFGSLRYINSAGTWSPDSRMFAFSALRGGRDVLVIMNAVRGGRLQEFTIPNVDEIANPTWSPDGTTIVVSGLSQGVTDLYAVNARTGDARRLTNDRFADMQPSFSPDGRTVAFTTDRGETDFDQLSFGEYRIGLMDFATGEIRTLQRADGGKNINPQWTSDGRGLYVISDREGINNIYRIEVATGALTQVTNLFTGVSGITDLSPAISSASRADRLVFAAYERGGFNIYSISNPTELAGTAPEPVQVAAAGIPGVPLPALLPPVPRPEDAPYNRVLLSLNEYRFGLPDAAAVATWTVRPYSPRLSLDYLGQPQIGASANTGGGFNRGGLYGGITGIFSDVLGRHTVFGTVQAQGQIEEIGFSTLYLNQASRWTWGVSAQRVPYVYGGRAQGYRSQTEFVQQEVRYRYFDTRLAGITQYPISQVQRMEFSGGVRRFASDVLVRELVTDVTTGATAYDERREEGNAFNLAEGSAALVYDNSLQGYTSPFAGQRYRVEVAPTLGTAQFTSVTGDYRRYFFLRPFTLAFRGLHVGRYGRDEALVGNLYLGWPFLMRGYSQSDVRNSCVESEEIQGNDCTLYGDELIGTRVGVANVELRVPVFQQIVLGGSFGLPPVEGFAFFDAGTAWGNTPLQNLGSGQQQLVRSSPNFKRGVAPAADERGVMTSMGVGGRVNLFGYAVLEAVYVNPLERDRGWHWQFALQPGF
ncbi:hypothetical protein [Longimicrobium sp.]|uniref:hypothetical protein n=1 Tax=Longimicrobium sp. TaxID=2029185 RepID=UPI002F944FC8